MPTIKEVIDEKNKDRSGPYFWVTADYEDAFADCEILAWLSVGDYQGDYFATLKGPDGRYGFVKIGYGSCSACDALEGELTDYHGKTPDQQIQGVTNFLQGVRDGVHWELTKEALRAWLTTAGGVDKEIMDCWLNPEEKESFWAELEKSVT